MRHALMSVLLAFGATETQQGPTDDAAALMDAARSGDRARVAELISAGVNVDTATRYGVTALSFAAEGGHFEIVRRLVEHGADVNAADSFYGMRPVDFALRGGHLDIALYLLEHEAEGASAVLNAAIRGGDVVAVKAALATERIDGAALARSNTAAARSGNAEIAALVKAAADATPATALPLISLPASLLRSYEGAYQSATTGAVVELTFDGTSLALATEGQPSLRLRPIEERRFIADEDSDVQVVLAGRGGIVERLSIVRGATSVRYEREGFGDATSPAPDPRALSTPSPAATARRTDDVLQGPSAPRATAAPWPQFRGTNAGGVADGQGIVTEWDVTTGKNIKWKTEIAGIGVSSPIVWGDRVIVVGAANDEDTTFRTGLTGDPAPVNALPTHTYSVYSLERESGEIVWRRDAFVGTPAVKRHFKSSQANSTPATNGRYIVAAFGSIGLVVCYDMNGTLQWTKDIGALDSGWFLDPSYQWGHSSSPIIYDGSVILQADQSRGSFIAAFDLATGRELWRTPRSEEVSTFATPTILLGGEREEIVTNGTKIRGYEAATGELLWTLEPNSEVPVGTPVVHRNLAIITAGYPPVRPIYAVRAGSHGDLSLPAGESSSEAIAWSHDRNGTYISSPVVYRDQLYTLNNNGIFSAYDANTGALIYRARVGGGGAFSSSPVATDGKLFLPSEDGDVFVIRAGEEYEEIGRYPMNEPVMASAAISAGLLIIRTTRHVWGIGR